MCTYNYMKIKVFYNFPFTYLYICEFDQKIKKKYVHMFSRNPTDGATRCDYGLVEGPWSDIVWKLNTIVHHWYVRTIM